MRFTTAILLTATVVIGLSTGLGHVHKNFTALVEQRGGADDVTPDLVLYWYDITEEDLREEDPQGFAALAEMPDDTARRDAAYEWMIRTRDIIFERRYGRPYTGRRDG